jgi:hypothetical protein
MLKKLVSVVLTFTMIAVSSTTSMASEEMSFSKAMAAKELNLNVSDIKRVDYVNCANITADKVITQTSQYKIPRSTLKIQ